MKRIETSMRYRLGLMGAALLAWVISAIADISILAGAAGAEARALASYATVAGVMLMFLAAVSAGYHLKFKLESRVAKGDLLDVGVMLAAVLLFIVIAIVRQKVSDSPLPLTLTLLGVGGLVTDWWVDFSEANDTLKNRRAL